MPRIVKEGSMSPTHRREPRNIRDVPPDSFGAQLRRLRMDAGLSQEELGAAIGTDQTRISAWENNKFRPQEDNIMDLAHALGVRPGVLMESAAWGGALPVGTERRERLKAAHERDWRLFDQVLDTLGEVTPEERARFERGFEQFLSDWHEAQVK